ARLGVARTWREPGAGPWRFSEAGIVITDLMLLDASPRAPIEQLGRVGSGPLMAAVDACNARFGRGSVVPARVGLVEKRTWSTKFEMRTLRYTTQVAELPRPNRALQASIAAIRGRSALGRAVRSVRSGWRRAASGPW
ncbi:DUF4113 domain-containing protein, partial [Methylobacterium sp. E-041]|uniref:DUF4113 domain-containing protein n=1 Tax=Methylobacterium sp. E-041 TaxID=2836573 RepID=UPI001FB89283